MENELDAGFCNYCGRDLRERSAGRKCPKCGAPNPVHVVFCGVCGTDLPPATEQEKVAEREAASRPAVAIPQPAASSDLPVCQWCKKPVSGYGRVCPHCQKDMITGVAAPWQASTASSYESPSYSSDSYYSSDLVESRQSPAPTIAGVLLILAGIVAMGQGVVYLVAEDIAASAGYGSIGIGCCGGMDLAFGVASLIGGVLAIQRNHFVLALLSCICAILSLAFLFVGPLLGLVAIVLLAVSKEEFD